LSRRRCRGARPLLWRLYLMWKSPIWGEGTSIVLRSYPNSTRNLMFRLDGTHTSRVHASPRTTSQPLFALMHGAGCLSRNWVPKWTRFGNGWMYLGLDGRDGIKGLSKRGRRDVVRATRWKSATCPAV
jgi:hypothetical protein